MVGMKQKIKKVRSVFLIALVLALLSFVVVASSQLEDFYKNIKTGNPELDEKIHSGEIWKESGECLTWVDTNMAENIKEWCSTNIEIKPKK